MHIDEKSTPNKLAIEICDFFRGLEPTQLITVQCKRAEIKLTAQQGPTVLEIFDFLRKRNLFLKIKKKINMHFIAEIKVKERARESKSSILKK